MRGGALAGLGLGALAHFGQLGRHDLVRLGEDDAVAHRGAVEHVEDLAVDFLDPVARVDQHEPALQRLAAAQIVVHQIAPLADHVLGRLGEAIAGHVDQAEAQRLAHVEEVQLLGAAGRVRSARQGVAAGQRVEQRRLAHVRAARERDLGHFLAGQELQRRRGLQERDRAGEGLSRGLDHIFVEPAHFAGASFFAGCFSTGWRE